MTAPPCHLAEARRRAVAPGCRRSGRAPIRPSAPRPPSLRRRRIERPGSDADRDRTATACADENDVAAIAVGPAPATRLTGRKAQLSGVEAGLVRESNDPLQGKVDPELRDLAPDIAERQADVVEPLVEYLVLHNHPRASRSRKDDEAGPANGDYFLRRNEQGDVVRQGQDANGTETARVHAPSS